MTPDENSDLPENDPDLLENTGLPKSMVVRLQKSYFSRLSDFDGMDDIDMLRQPNVNRRMVEAIKAERASRDARRR
ncbi:hypothetical protein GOZ90_17335 [Agrobacterium vitis]|uniref:Uncharacterized protein n=1 Tax=Agrobacterium vitis TaxID=373 RepID=A0A6L6VFH2_AGRVI|nr:hypothetical protein [Agrobacterium vitis]MUZ74454.1 hypothetical protein [Agrobacterium vitis]